MSDSKITMSFSEGWQEAIIGHCFLNYEFFLKVKQNIEPSWFAKSYYTEILKGLVEFHNKFNKVPSSLEEFVDHKFRNGMGLSLSDVQKYTDITKRCVLTTRKFTIDVVRSDLTSWARMAKLKNSVEELERFWQKKEYEKGAQFLKQKSMDIIGTNFDKDTKASFSNLWEFFKEVAQDAKGSCTIGHPYFDKLLDDDSKWSEDYKAVERGSLHRGDLTVFMGPSNAGKTTALVSIAAANIRLGKHVIYLTHEQKDKDIKKKVVQCLAGISTKHINEWQRLADKDGNMSLMAAKSEIGQRIAAAEKILEEYLVYVPWTKSGGMFVEDVVSEIQLQQEKLIARIGKGFDLLIEDYPAKLRTREFGGKRSERRDELEYVYDQFQILAKEFNLHSLVASQTNRDGYKIANKNNGSAEKRLLDQGDIADSFGIARIADNVITINRGPEEIRASSVIFNVSKSRSNSTGHQFKSVTAFDRSQTHGISLECNVLRNGQNIPDVIPVLKRDNYVSEADYKPVGIIEQMLKTGKTEDELAEDNIKKSLGLEIGSSEDIEFFEENGDIEE